MNIAYTCVAALVGTLLMCAHPAFAQTSVGPNGENDQVILTSLKTGDSAGLESAAATPSGILGIMSPENHCGIEPHPKAINPDLIECHAAFAPVPIIPVKGSLTTLTQREAFGTWLIEQLSQPGVCGKGTRIGVEESCAILIFTLDKEDRKVGVPLATAMPWVFIVKVYRISHPADLSQTTIYIVNSDDSESTYGPGKDPVWHLLAEQRPNERCKEAKTKHVGTGVSSSGLKDDSCPRRSDDLRYTLKLILPLSQAERVLNEASIDYNFDAPTFVVQAKGAFGSY